MDIPLIIMVIGILLIITSFFIKDPTKQLEQDLEELSISVFQETNNMKRRLKVVEEELLLDPSFQVKSPNKNAAQKQAPMEAFQQVAAQVRASQGAKHYQSTNAPVQEKPIHGILISQVIELNKQGLSIDEISKRSTLTYEQIQTILSTNGGM